jgi:hypothetical protein
VIQHLANDALTRVRNPEIAPHWHVPRIYIAGSRDTKDGRPYKVRRFIVCSKSVFMQVRFRGEPRYTSLFIGFEENFQERLVLS